MISKARRGGRNNRLHLLRKLQAIKKPNTGIVYK